MLKNKLLIDYLVKTCASLPESAYILKFNVVNDDIFITVGLNSDDVFTDTLDFTVSLLGVLDFIYGSINND